MRIYLDNCCYNRPFDDRSLLSVRMEAEAKLLIQEDIRLGRHELIWSYMNEYENDASPYDERREAVLMWRQFAAIIIRPRAAILENARRFQACNLKSKDALHISCSIAAGCSHFLTTDLRLLRKASLFSDVRLINPIDFIRELEAEYDTYH